MTSTEPAEDRAGGLSARRAMLRWAWRLFRREWRQQLLVLALIVVAVGATVVGSAVATNTPEPSSTGFGSAHNLAAFQLPDPQLASQLAALQRRVGRVDVIENETLTVPGTNTKYALRAQDPAGPYGRPMLSLLSGRYPAGAGEVAMTQALASTLGLSIGAPWHEGATDRTVVGIVENPQNLLDEFALVAPGQVTNPTEVTALFDGFAGRATSIGKNVSVQSLGQLPSNTFNPETITLAADTLGMLLIALVGAGGFTVLAQRRLRSLGMLGSIGATKRHIGLVVRANGVVVGVVGAVLGAALGFAAWLAYRPSLEASAHHVIGPFALPWTVVLVSMALAIVATYFAASRPARAIARVPIVAALSGRPVPARQLRRSFVPGLVLLVGDFFLFTWSAQGSGAKGNTPVLIVSFVVLIAAVILLSPFCLTVLARLARHAPIAVRLALRDLSRYRARSGSALAAISLGVLIAVVISVASAGRFANVLDYAGPNLASNQMALYTPNGPYGAGGPGHAVPGVSASRLRSMAATASAIATSLGSHQAIELETTVASLNHNAAGRNWSGPIFVATPSLLRAFSIPASQVDAHADILTMRPGLSDLSKMQLTYGTGGQGTQRPQRHASGPAPQSGTAPCTAKHDCLANPVIEEVSALPSGTSAPNTLITEHAVNRLHLATQVAGWLIVAAQPPTASQITNARLAASAAGMTIETKNSMPSGSEVVDWATAFGIVLALGILGMSVGLIRAETASDLRTLAATGASGTTRRTLAAATAGGLGVLGAVLGTVAGYVGVWGFFRGSALNGGASALLSSIPVANLLFILVGMPALAAIVAWLTGGRTQPDISRHPLE
jgi:putative ABC transport system permease protein